ncbi:dTDP-4-dehydrorhamnose reductase [Campylobacter coli]|nr:dTDP-4-dehydrorhamnose reductase [Campylobacter coli]HED0672696.1 dTDP-4-dehydrorhamnose reductase [Campylobacter jejuni]APA52069.1 dTDP-4-dehydrorhamnose reductase [Campylobacter coli]APA61088.1 dTDP-4-dehydrorhamnose reductase [Campylobacter coli]EAC1565363.1 dTDP-4-dehydrorhamnose reductase [Campylobacter coli]EAC1601996.1 dTDP-4-dehydrorhamnose reductase [Campylobacter coli]
MNRSIAILGSNGQLGKTFQELSSLYKKKYSMFFFDKTQINIQDKNLLEYFIDKYKFDYIINCAAYTDVNLAEVKQKEAYMLNYNSVENIADLTKKYNLTFIHISTDYVFDGKSCTPYKENDKTKPLNVYGKSKLRGEQVIVDINPKNTIVIRTSWLYSNYKGNFVHTVRNLGKKKGEINVVYDQIGTPTYARDLAEVILNILPYIQNDKPEIYHYSNEGIASWYDFAKEIMKLSQLGCNIKPIESKDFLALAPRPSYSVLNKQKIKEKFHIEIPYWRDSLEKCISMLQKDDIL